MDSTDRIFNLLCDLSKSHGVSGKETDLLSFLPNVMTDEIGNRYVYYEGRSENAKTLLVEAHMDEIGLCVSEILEGGFVSVIPCGGVDTDTLPGTKWLIDGKETIPAIASSVPPHLASLTNPSKKNGFDNVYLDTGFKTKAETEAFLSVGDVAYYCDEPKKMLGSRICGRGLDNKASVLALILALQKLENPEHNVLFLFSVGEETSSRGVRFACKKWKPDFALVLDAGFAVCDGVDETRCIRMDEGPSVSMTDTLSVSFAEWVKKIATEHSVPLQIIAEPGGTGTSATAIQTECGGIPSAVISIPLWNMHTQSEIVSCADVEKTAELILAICKQTCFPGKEVILRG